MTRAAGYRWEFRARFRRDAFGWRSQPAILRVKQAVAEIKKVAKKDPELAAEGTVLFLERVSAALAQVDSSSGAIGTAVNKAIAELVPVIANTEVDAKTREVWLERLWIAHQDDQIPYIENLTDYWGDLCASKEVASAWADRLIEGVTLAWMTNRTHYCHFQGASACLSALLRAERHDELLALLKLNDPPSWHYHEWGVRALAALDRNAEAIEFAESLRGPWTDERALARLCEEILLSSGQVDEAYRRYGIEANGASTYLATFRALLRKYTHLAPEQLLSDLVASTPGQEGKWFAAAKDAGFFDIALRLATTSPCDPRTLARAARDHAESNPEFAIGAGLAALHWIADGFGYEISGADVWAAYFQVMGAAEKAGQVDEVKERIRQIAMSGRESNFVTEVLGKQSGLP